MTQPNHHRRKRTARNKKVRGNAYWAFLTEFANEDLASRGQLPDLSRKQILAWSDALNDRTGQWPKKHSGPIPEAPGESWLAVEAALSLGLRGLPGGETLPRLLAEKRHVRNIKALPPLTGEQILSWADAHRRRTG